MRIVTWLVYLLFFIFIIFALVAFYFSGDRSCFSKENINAKEIILKDLNNSDIDHNYACSFGSYILSIYGVDDKSMKIMSNTIDKIKDNQNVNMKIHIYKDKQIFVEKIKSPNEKSIRIIKPKITKVIKIKNQGE